MRRDSFLGENGFFCLISLSVLVITIIAISSNINKTSPSVPSGVPKDEPATVNRCVERERERERGGTERERGGGTERERERRERGDREADRQTDRQARRQTDRQTETEIGGRDRQTDKDTGANRRKTETRESKRDKGTHRER